MADARLIWDPVKMRADLSMSGSALDTTHDLETAVLISLFTDHVSDPGDVLPVDRNKDPRGWWADTYETPDLIGSKLWQVMNRVNTQDTLNFARDTAVKSLQWMIDDGVASAVDVTCGPLRGGLRLDISITEPSGAVTPFTYAWQQEV